MADLLMAQEIKAEVYQLSVYDPSSPSLPLSLSFFVTWSVTQTAAAAWKMISKKLRLHSFLARSFLSLTPRDVTGHCFLFQH